MKFKNLFKRKSDSDYDLRSVKEIVRRLVDYIPEFYFNQPQYLNCIEFLNQHEWELTLDSLIELADESGHFFSEEYWKDLSVAALKMNLNEKSNYCIRQIQHNKEHTQSITPFGWTTIKLDENHYQHHISERLKNEWAVDRRTKDHVY